MSAILAAVAGAAVGAVVSGVMGSVSAKQSAKAQKDMMEEQNMMNMENYKKRYQLTVNDMRQAGLNPILAATGGFSVGNAPQVQTHAPDLSYMTRGMSDIANSAKSFFDASKVDEETEKIKAETEKLKNDADLSLAEAAKSRGITVLSEKQAENVAMQTMKTEFDIKETMSRTEKNYAEIS